jgi:putative ABC transport system permease protein
MFRNYLTIAIRNIKRHKGYSFINIAGLAVGMACSILILAWVRDERGTNRFHEKIDSLYIVRTAAHYGSEVSHTDGSVPALGPALKAEFPEVRNAARLNNGQRPFLIELGGQQFREAVQPADPQIFELFTLPLVKGRLEDILSGPDVLVLSESAAGRLFGREDPVGKVLTLDKRYDLRVAAVMKDIPANSTIRFDIWVPLELTRRFNARPNYIDTWYNMGFRTYLEMAPGTDIAAFNTKIAGRIRRSYTGQILEPSVYPFKDLYLKVWGRQQDVRTFAVIGFLILVIACINFMNLTTARAARRSREVGLRKVVGAERAQIMRQFFGEALIFTVVSLALAVGLAGLALPAFRHLTAKTLALADFLKPGLLAAIAGVGLLAGLLAGLYPAVVLSSFRPAAVLKGNRGASPRGSLFRKSLVVVQFALTSTLIVATVVIFNQVRFMKTKSLGFDREHLLYLPIEGELAKNIDGFKQELLRIPGVRSASPTTHSPTGIYTNGQGFDWPGRNPDVDPLVTFFGVDPDFLETFQMTLVRGETFRPGAPGRAIDVVINERFAGIINSPDIIGAGLTGNGLNMRVIGVVKDFHFKPVDREIGPILIFYDPTYRAFQQYRHMFVRLRPGDVRAAVAEIERAFRARNPGYPFEFRFLDDDYDLLYRAVEREMGIIRTFAALAILVSCLGLFGLAAYTAEQRTKEIGIRKVMGATVPGVVVLLSGEYARWVLAANIIGGPAAYVLMRSWLKDYPYRTPLAWWIFVLAAAATLVIAQLTVSWQAVRAARTEPVKTLRYE